MLALFVRMRKTKKRKWSSLYLPMPTEEMWKRAEIGFWEIQNFAKFIRIIDCKNEKNQIFT
ncbi:hypothetical protein PR048_013362 [Dryococelus australis]|uniref:Uncharacterized protein n=1 Tax=Dryococelus australis TaxID=614101 RepID=A0ABQ9HRY2_9NEOP|nr:hypothetical protein PR048_013362 [Dryococelus australis]